MILLVSMQMGLGMRPEVLVDFLVPVIKYMTNTTYIRKCFFLLVFGGISPLLWRRRVRHSVRELSTQVCSREAEMTSSFVSMALLTFRVAPPSSAKSLWKCPHRAHTCLLGNPKCSQVDVKVNHVPWILLSGASETEGLTASQPQPGGSQNL